MSKDQTRARALAAMLECNTLTDAAKAAGISRKTLYTYIRTDDAFGVAYRAARDQLALEQMDALTDGRQRATALLLALLEDDTQPASVRIKAAQTILAAATKQQETAQGARIALPLLDDL